MPHSMKTRSQTRSNDSVSNNIVIQSSSRIMKRGWRSQKRQNRQVYTLNGFTESDYNIFDGQQVCAVRDTDLREYYDDAKRHYYDKIETYLQYIYDAGCAIMNMGIVEKYKDSFRMNSTFGDIESWYPREQAMIDNCLFLREMGHSMFK